MGGRHIFPPLARTRYPNWQLVSINQVIDNIRFNLKSASASASIAFSDMRLERDANLMLGSQVVDLFLPVDISQKYDFSYNQDSHVLTVVRKDKVFMAFFTDNIRQPGLSVLSFDRQPLFFL